jgi:hypothetical protein
MKIWRGYGSGHSAHLSIIATFKDVKHAQLAREVIDDFLRYVWTEADTLDVGAFYQNWKQRLGGVETLGPRREEFQMGIDDAFDVDLDGTAVSISHIRSAEIGGIIKLLLLAEPLETTVLGETGP